jgi:hypothetical protein
MSSPAARSTLGRSRMLWTRLGAALCGFLQGFVGPTDLPTEPRAARHALTHRANGRGRCC